MAHNIFISWSGEVSRQVAVTLHEWLPSVIQVAEPFMSDKDIDAGKRGLDEIANQLSEIRVGVICVTADNQSAPWLNFEAGSLSKLNDQKTYVIPLALDLEHGQVRLPIGQFQAKQFTQGDMRHVVASINKALGQPLTNERLARAFDKHWEDLDTRITRIRATSSEQGEEQPRRTVEDMLEELVSAAREQGNFIRDLAYMPLRPLAMNAQYIVTEAALRRLGQAYGEPGPMSLKTLADTAEYFDNKDWETIETSPFLVWYLERYRGITRPTNPPGPFGDLDDTPF